jgi:hypothetical protein
MKELEFTQDPAVAQKFIGKQVRVTFDISKKVCTVIGQILGWEKGGTYLLFIPQWATNNSGHKGSGPWDLGGPNGSELGHLILTEGRCSKIQILDEEHDFLRACLRHPIHQSEDELEEFINAFKPTRE